MTEEQSSASDQPAAPPTVQGPMTFRNPNEGKEVFDTYQTITETVTGLSLNKKDNKLQAVIILAGTLLSGLVGFIGWGAEGAAAGVGVGLVGSLLLSGTILMVLGWVRLGQPRK